MAVATAAATTMANNAEAARPRRRIAARTSIRTNIEVWGPFARLAARSRAECDPIALTVPPAARTPDQGRLPAESPQHYPQTSPRRQLPGSLETTPAESKSEN